MVMYDCSLVRCETDEFTPILSGEHNTEEYNHSRFEFHRKKFYKGEKKKRKAIAEGEIDQEQVNNEMIGILMEE